MGVKTESKSVSSDNERTEGVGGKPTETPPVGDDAGVEAEFGAAKTTMSSKQDETVKVELTWKMTDFAEKMRVQEAVCFTKELDLERHVDTRAGSDSSLLHALLNPRLTLDVSFTPVHLVVKGNVSGIGGVGTVGKTGVGPKVDDDIKIDVETFVMHESGKRKSIVDEKIDYEFLLYQNSGLALVWAHKDTLTLGMSASMTFHRAEEWALWDHGTYRLDEPSFDLRMRKMNRIECMNILANVMSALPTDIVMRVGRKSVSAHKAVLVEHSRVIAAMMRANPKFTEIEIEDVSLAAVKEFKIFCYTGEMPNVAALGEELLLFCDSFDIETMARAVDEFLVRALTVGAVVRTLLLADCHKRHELRSRCITFVEKNHAAVYQTEAWRKLKEFSGELYNEVVARVSQSALRGKEEVKEDGDETAEETTAHKESDDATGTAQKKDSHETAEETAAHKESDDATGTTQTSRGQPHDSSLPPPPQMANARLPGYGMQHPQMPQHPRMPFHPQMMQQPQMAYQPQMQQHPMMQQPQSMQYPQLMPYPQMLAHPQSMFPPQMMQSQGGMPPQPPDYYELMQNPVNIPNSGTTQQTAHPVYNQNEHPQMPAPASQQAHMQQDPRLTQNQMFQVPFGPQMPPNLNMPRLPQLPPNMASGVPYDISVSLAQNYPGLTQSYVTPEGENAMTSTGQSVYADAEMNKLMATLPPIPDITDSTFGTNQHNANVDSIKQIMMEHENFMKSLTQSQCVLPSKAEQPHQEKLEEEKASNEENPRSGDEKRSKDEKSDRREEKAEDAKKADGTTKIEGIKKAEDVKNPEDMKELDMKRAEDAKKDEDSKKAEAEGVKKAEDVEKPEDVEKAKDLKKAEETKKAENTGNVEKAKDLNKAEEAKKAETTGDVEKAKDLNKAEEMRKAEEEAEEEKAQEAVNAKDVGKAQNVKVDQDTKKAQEAKNTKDMKKAQNAKKADDMKNALDTKKVEAEKKAGVKKVEVPKKTEDAKDVEDAKRGDNKKAIVKAEVRKKGAKKAEDTKKATDPSKAEDTKKVEGKKADTKEPLDKKENDDGKKDKDAKKAEEKVQATGDMSLKADAVAIVPGVPISSAEQDTKKQEKDTKSIMDSSTGANLAATTDVLAETAPIDDKKEKTTELMEKNEKWKKMVDSFSEDTIEAIDGGGPSADPPASTDAGEEAGESKDRDDDWEKIASLKKEEDENWEKVMAPRQPAEVDDDDEEWEKVTSVRIYGKKEKRKSKPVSAEDKWENVNAEMKKKLERRREKEEEEAEEEEAAWQKVTNSRVEEVESNFAVEEKRVEVADTK